MHSHTNTLNNTIHTKSLRDSMAGAKRSLRITSVHNTTLSVYFSWLTSFQFQVASLAWTKIWFYGQNTQNKEHTVQSIDVRKILKDCSGFFLQIGSHLCTFVHLFQSIWWHLGTSSLWVIRWAERGFNQENRLCKPLIICEFPQENCTNDYCKYGSRAAAVSCDG